jgi:hypothetical protein
MDSVDVGHKLQLIKSQNPDKNMQGGKFTDDVFPPNSSSINMGSTVEKTLQEEEKKPRISENLLKRLKDSNINIASLQQNKYSFGSQPKEHIWKRISEILPEYYLCRTLEKEDELIDDVVQGSLGDCYFVSALSALAEKKDRITRIFNKSEQIQSNGLYELEVFIDGKPVTIFLDDYFPCNNEDIDLEKEHHISLAFSSIEKVSLNIWPLLLEKCWAKVNLNYKNIVEGNVMQAFNFLNPAPVEVSFHSAPHIIKDHTILLEKMEKADQLNYIICADISDKGNASPINLFTEMGLLTNHAYTIISIHTVTSRSGEEVKLLKLRNPWGQLEWNGDWSDKSEKWTAELKKEIGTNFDSDEGIFFMSFQDYYRFFTCTYICMNRQDYNYNYKEFNFANKNDNTFIAKLKINEQVKQGYITLNLKTAKIYRNLLNDKSFENAYFSFVVYDNNSDKEKKYIGSVSGRLDRIYLEVNLEPGEYLICVKCHSNNIQETSFSESKFTDDSIISFKEYINESKVHGELNNSFVIGLYSSLNNDKIIFSEFKYENISLIEHDFFSFFSNKANFLPNSQKEYFYQEGEPNSFRVMHFATELEPYGLLYYKNESNAYINEKHIITELRNIRLLPFHSGLGDRIFYNEDVEEVYEDQDEDSLVNKLRKFETFKSSFSYNHIVKGTSRFINDLQPLELLITVAPFSTFLILFEKCDETAGIKSDSVITMRYPIDFLWSERKFHGKKTRIKYKDTPIDIFECIIKHPSGVIFKYKNKTKEYRLEVKVNLEGLENLTINSEYSNLYEELKRTEIQDGDHFKIFLEPKENIFIELRTINQFAPFSFNSKMEYNIKLSESYFESGKK